MTKWRPADSEGAIALSDVAAAADQSPTQSVEYVRDEEKCTKEQQRPEVIHRIEGIKRLAERTAVLVLQSGAQAAPEVGPSGEIK